MDNNELLQAALAKVVADSISPEIRNGLFKDAIQNFLFYGTDRDGKLKHAFEEALGRAAIDIAKEIVNAPENREKMVKILQVRFDETIKIPALQDKMIQTAFRGY